MKKLIITARNHMDPSWRRCFTNHYTYGGNIIHPYSDIEEALISQYLRFLDGHGWKYSLEQSLVMQRYLERNPDEKQHIASLIEQGKLELLGGGTTVIDYNLPCGESAYRNHYYSIKYYLETFGTRPKYADLPDSFGLPAQIPQMLRQFGYIAVTQYDRVFWDNKPVWQGLDGSRVLLWAPKQVMQFHYPDCYKYTSCPSCHGDGCEICDGTGMDYSYDYRYHEFPREREGLVFYAGPRCSTAEFLDEFAASDKDEYIMSVTTEETLHIENYPQMLAAMCAERGIEPVFMTHVELLEHTRAELLQGLREDTVPEDAIDSRVEGNPVATGCYTSRIELKKKNRMLEQLALSTEKLAAIALPAEAYPHKKFARVWQLLAFLQFHDCVTASHCDASYDELLTTCREIYCAVGAIRKQAMQAIEAKTAVADKAGWRAVLAINPTNRAVSDLPITVVVRDSHVFENVELCDAQGNALPVLAVHAQDNALDCAAIVKTLLPLPAMGVRVVYWRPAEKKTAAATAGNTIENEYFIVSPDAIVDKKRGKVIGKNALAISYDFGHPWGRLAEEAWYTPLPDTTACVTEGDSSRTLTLTGGYIDPEKNITALRWCRALTLYDGVDKVFIHTELDWAGESTHVYAELPLAFDHGQSAYYEIPYGMLERADVIQGRKFLGIEDEWPALNYLAAYDAARDLSVVVYNNGTPGCRVKDGSLQISLLRSPTVQEFANEGARDHGHHVYEHAIAVVDGKPTDGEVAGFGLRFVTPMPSIAAIAKDGGSYADGSQLFPLASDNTTVQICAIKRDEGGALIARMYESCGKAAVLAMPEGCTAIEVDPLETEVLSDPQQTLTFTPFEIKTVRIL